MYQALKDSNINRIKLKLIKHNLIEHMQKEECK